MILFLRPLPFSPSNQSFLAAICSYFERQSYKESSFSSHWQQAIGEEVVALANIHTLGLVHLPPRKILIGSKWIHKIKNKTNDSIERSI